MDRRAATRAYLSLIAVLLGTGVASLGKVSPDRRPAQEAAAARLASSAADLPRTTSAAAPSAPAPAGRSGLVSPEAADTAGAGARLVRTGAYRPARGASPQDRAKQVAGDPASFYWALIIGINDYAGGTRDNIGSYQDAVALRAHLLAFGWRSDHVMILANRAATRDSILRGIRWLAAKTDERSLAVFHYSGHEKPFSKDVDGDGEARDVALWASDNALVVDGDLGRELGRVRAGRMWLDFSVCRAGGFNDPGTVAEGRVVTYSSPERELSYEDPSVHHSVFGFYSIVEGMRDRWADENSDGNVTVQEAFAYARPKVVSRTSNRQHPLMIDHTAGGFSLVPPSAPSAPAPQDPEPEPEPTPCTLPVGCVAYGRAQP
jgi:hypothetical protein